jgi:hypothetical protein
MLESEPKSLQQKKQILMGLKYSIYTLEQYTLDISISDCSKCIQERDNVNAAML